MHNSEYSNRFIENQLCPKAQRKIGFPKSNELIERTLYSIGASIEGAKMALSCGLAGQISGGYHHSYPDHGSGFCIFNDLVIAARELIDKQLCKKVIILDLDVHQGDGTAVCAAPFNDVITVSLHCEQNFPSQKQYSDYDFSIDKHAQNDTYLTLLEQCLMAIRIEQPDIVLYNAGADIFSGDELGYFDVSLEGVKQRDFRVVQFCKEHEVPLFTVSGGGYQRDVSRLVVVHSQLYLSMINA